VLAFKKKEGCGASSIAIFYAFRKPKAKNLLTDQKKGKKRKAG